MENSSNGTVNVQSEQQTDVRQSWEYALENENYYVPFVDIYETKDEFVLTANLPGVSRDNIKLKLEENTLSIFGKVNYEEQLQRKYLLNETGIGNYFRKFRISEAIDQSKIDALYENGQLIVKLPKHDKVKPRTINIK